MEARTHGVERRGFIRAAVAATGAAAMAAGAASAQDKKAARLPMDTPVTKLGFNAKEVEVMTPAAQKLTKGDMLGIRKLHTANPNQTTAQVVAEYNKEKNKKITVEDIQSIEKAFQLREERQHAPGAAAADVTACCCCCPCCTCTASVVVAPVAP
jgi:hypothetical protein